MSVWSDFLGTTRSFFKIGFTGVRLKNNSGNLSVRNTGDSADAEVTTSKLNNSGDSIVINSDGANTGTDRTLTLSKNPAASANLEVQFPAAKGTDGYLVRQKAGTSAGVIEFELVAPTSSSTNVSADTTTLAFGSVSPVAMVTTSATAVIDKIQIIIDTAFNGTPSASIGIVGTTSKYAPSTDIDLTQVATTVIELHPGLPAAGSPENLIITYSAGGASAGSARFILYYTDAPA